MSNRGNELSEELTDKEEMYAQLRAAGYNKSKSASKAYPDASPNSARQMGYEAEKRDRVAERIRELKEERAELSDIDVKEQVRRYNELYFMALEKGQLVVAKQMLERMDAIAGLDAPTRSVNLSIKETTDTLRNPSKSIEGEVSRFADVLRTHSSGGGGGEIIEGVSKEVTLGAP